MKKSTKCSTADPQVKRPHWGPKQVRTLRGLNAGQIYLYVHAPSSYQSSYKIIILSKPFQDSKGFWKYKYASWPLRKKKRSGLLHEHFCCDSGIVPYRSGTWNQGNSLRRIQYFLSKKELAKIHSILTKDT